MRPWFELGELVILIGWVIMERMRLRILVIGGCLGGLLMLGVIFLEFVLVGVRLFSACIGFFNARAVVNHDGVAGPALDPLVWSSGGAPKRRRVVHAVRDRAFLRGPAGIWDGGWGVVAVTHITCHDVELWPYSVSVLVKWVAFLKTLHWPQGGLDLGVGGISFEELLILYELWAGERLSLEKAHSRYLRPGHSISVSAVPCGPGIDIWRSCRFIGAVMRSLCLLLGELGRFVPCSIGANHCRLRHIGWERCGHGLTSRPRESASGGFLNELPVLFEYPSGSAAALLNGELPLRYCSGKFACRLPTWCLPSCGHVHGLVAEFAGIEEVPWGCPVAHARLPGLIGGARVLRGGNFWGVLKEFGYTEKPQHTLQDMAGRGVLSLVQGFGRD